MCLVYEANGLCEVLVEGLDEGPNEAQLSLIEDLKHLGVQVFHRDVIETADWASALYSLLPCELTITCVLLGPLLPRGKDSRLLWLV